MIRLLLILNIFICVYTADAQNFFYLSAGNSTIVACNSTTTSVFYNINSSASGLYTITLQPPTGGTTTLATSASIGHVFTAAAGVYTITGYDGASTVLGVIHYTVAMSTVFNPTITVSAGTICSGETSSLSFTPVTSGYTINPFSWSTTQTITPISVSPTITTSYTLGGLFTAGTRTCTVSDSTTITVNACVGIEELIGNFAFKIYPNPVSSVLHISTEQNIPNGSQLEITNVLGETITKKGFENTIDLNALQNGYYFLTIITPSGSRYRNKFIKE